MHLFPILLISLLPALTSAVADPIFFNLEVFMHKRSFAYYIDYAGDISKKSRFGKTQDVFALLDGQLLETQIVEGKLVPNSEKIVSFPIGSYEVVLQDFKTAQNTELSVGTGSFGIDDKGFLQWTVGSVDEPEEDKAVWCSKYDKIMITMNETKDKRCVGWSLKARIVDVSAGVDEL